MRGCKRLQAGLFVALTLERFHGTHLNSIDPCLGLRRVFGGMLVNILSQEHTALLLEQGLRYPSIQHHTVASQLHSLCLFMESVPRRVSSFACHIRWI